MIKIRCPGCSKTLNVRVEAGGSQMQCPTCSAPFRVPKAKAAQAEPERQPDDSPQPDSRRDYVASSLLPGERVTYWARPHWFIFISPGIWITLAFIAMIAGFVAERDDRPVFVLMAGILATIGVALLLDRCMVYTSCEFAVTTSRVILKTGFFNRKSLELLHSRIDSLSVDQGIMGRIFGFGTVGVGVATERQLFPFISDPLEFRRQVQAQQL